MHTAGTRFRDPMRRPALACGALVGLAILLALVGGKDYSRVLPSADAVARSARLWFSDAPGGVVIVSDAASGATVASLSPGKGGFIRVTLRSMASDRQRRGLGAEAPFSLIRTTGGKLVLSDPETGRIMALDAFGPTNAAAFAMLLDRTGGAP